MKHHTTNMFAATSEDLPLFSGMDRTSVVVEPHDDAKIQMKYYRSLTRTELLREAKNSPREDWYHETQDELSILNLVTCLLADEFGDWIAETTIQKYWNR